MRYVRIVVQCRAFVPPQVSNHETVPPELAGAVRNWYYSSNPCSSHPCSSQSSKTRPSAGTHDDGDDDDAVMNLGGLMFASETTKIENEPNVCRCALVLGIAKHECSEKREKTRIRMICWRNKQHKK
jgi:hypothetical protein